MFSRRSHKPRVFYFLSISILILFCIRPYPRIHLTRTIQFQHRNGDLGDQLFSFFTQLGVANALQRVPVLNVFNDSEFVDRLSKLSMKFPTVLEQFMIVIEPISQPNAELGMDHFEDPVDKLSEYTTIDMMIRGRGFRSYKYFHHLQSEIRQWMMLGNAEHVEEARKLLPEHLRQTFKLCVHGSDKTDEKLTISAIKRISEATASSGNWETIVVSGIPELLGQKILENSKFSNIASQKIFLSDSSPESHLTFSRLYCDAVLLTAPTSTMGWWMGYLAKDGSTVFYTDSDEVQRKEDHFPVEWQKIN